MGRRRTFISYAVGPALLALVLLAVTGWSIWRAERANIEFQAIGLEFEELALEFLATIGFDGIIHDFKNCVIRSTEPRYCDLAQAKADQAMALIDRLDALADDARIDIETGAMRDAVLTYGAAAAEVAAGHAAGLSIPEIDARVRYDDQAASAEIWGALELARIEMQTRLENLGRVIRLQALAAGAIMLGGLMAIFYFMRREIRLSQVQEERLFAIFSAMTSGVIGLDEDAHIILANPVAQDMLKLGTGLPPYDWPGTLSFHRDDGDSGALKGRELAKLAIGPEPLRAEILRLDDSQTKSDGIYVRASSVAVTPDSSDRSSLATVLMLDDVTAQETSRQQVERNSRLDALGQLSGGVAHDFNNLLATILYAIELAKRAVQDQKARTLLDRAISAVTRGRNLTERLMTFAVQQPGRSRSLPVEMVFDNLMELTGSAIEANIEIDYDISEPGLIVHCDPSQLENALLNLVFNSRDAIRGSGVGDRIRLSARRVTSMNRSLLNRQQGALVADTEHYRFVELSVSDNGPGMTGEVRRRAADPFFSTRKASGGTGLGLAMVYGFVQQSRGEMQIYSDEGRGTTVRLILPTGMAEDRREDPQPQPELAPDGDGRTVLLVEDEPDLLDMVSDMLTELGYRVIPARNGTMAMGIVDSGEDFDLLLSDIVMPGGMDGTDLAVQVRNRFPNRGIVLMSGYVSLSSRNTAAVDFPILQKPCAPSDLAAALRAAMPGGQGPDEGVD
ncbi:MAG: hypothetical protein CML68_09000 [Rhodobacteraceae bacterium]|nr:hypothetical protein [Paracoccaceae bacterium]